jgi:hypothetical protein
MNLISQAWGNKYVGLATTAYVVLLAVTVIYQAYKDYA